MRVRHRLVCETLSRRTTAYVVSSDGAKTGLGVPCSTEMREARASLPGVGPWSIVVLSDERHLLPCNYPDFSKSPAYEIDDVAFE